MGGGPVELEPIVRCTLKVAQNTLDQLHVTVPWRMHEEAHLLNCVGDVWSGKGKVLESTGEAAVLRGIGEEVTGSSRRFRAGVDGHGDGLAVEHFGTIKNLEGILLLTEKQTRGIGGDVDAQEVVELAEIRHGELGLEGRDDVVECVGGVGSENNVINVHQKIGNACSLMKYEQGGVTPCGIETKRKEEPLEPKKPLPWRLLQPIQRLVK